MTDGSIEVASQQRGKGAGCCAFDAEKAQRSVITDYWVAEPLLFGGWFLPLAVDVLLVLLSKDRDSVRCLGVMGRRRGGRQVVYLSSAPPIAGHHSITAFSGQGLSPACLPVWPLGLSHLQAG
ncbi:hypothetical protein ACIQTZ_00470 [Paenarthrobacter sp. NPDC090520]|uniref:hypothetical protein n=1 Tax=Paenarthrobacter sp. NPDC090520 TaxID=3364382 RepID=UPI0037F702EC